LSFEAPFSQTSIVTVDNMSDSIIQSIESQVDQLIARCEQLEQNARELENENSALLERQENWKQERKLLIEKNSKARSRVEAMISHLKTLNAAAELQSTP
jgi:cell division protein ZapB